MIGKNVVVVDYGLGNLYSVQRALEHCGVEKVCVSSSVDDISSADSLILPGVGAFEDGIRGLKELGLIEQSRIIQKVKKLEWQHAVMLVGKILKRIPPHRTTRKSVRRRKLIVLKGVL